MKARSLFGFGIRLLVWSAGALPVFAQFQHTEVQIASDKKTSIVADEVVSIAMFKKIHIFLAALIFVVVIAGQQVQAQLTQATPQPTEVSPARIQVQRIEVKGSIVFGEAELNPIIKPLEGRSVTIEELRRVADAISQLYLDGGYITSRAILVEDSLSSGFIEIQVLEGSVERVVVEGARLVDTEYISSRIENGIETPLNTGVLEEKLRLLRVDPRFDSVEASLRGGTGVGESVLVVQVIEADHIRTRIRLSENSPLSVANASLFERLQSNLDICNPECDVYGEIEATFNNTKYFQKKLAQIERDTGTKSALIYATFLNDHLELRLFTKAENKFVTVSGTTSTEIFKTADKLRQEITNPIKRRSTSYLPSAQQLYQWLIKPLEADLEAQKINNLVFIMDYGLGLLPIAALHDGQGFLVEKYSIGLMPSFGLTDISYRNIQNEPVLAIGISEPNNNIEEVKNTGLSPLPAVANEIKTIMELRGRKSLLNQQANLENLKTESRNFSIVHLATHAEFKGELNNSYILLWDKLLRFDQIRELGWNKRQPPLELLVISACKTAVGDYQTESNFAGFAMQAGVKSVLASLWYVSDEGTSELMIKFYQQLKTAPIKAEALRQAQLAMMQSDDFKHPYYWSAFTMIGSPW